MHIAHNAKIEDAINARLFSLKINGTTLANTDSAI
jgi:hypothetical protein